MKKYIFITAIAAAVCLTGCKDFLTEAPILSQSDELTLSTYEDLDLSVLGAYAPLASSSWYNAEFITSNELRTGNGKKLYGTTWDTGRVNDWYSFTYSASTTSSVWGNGYYVISAANNVMDNLDGVEGDEQDKNNLRAECLFLRAFSHFDILRMFAQPYCYTSDASHDGIPIILHTDPSDQSPRSTVKEVYDQIIEDLLEAESIIDPDYVRSGVTDARAAVSIEVIQALLARVYLYSQQWSKAAEYATKVIDSGKYTMWTVDDMDGSKINADNLGVVHTCFNQSVGSGEVIFEIYESNGMAYGGGANDNICGLTNWDGYGDAAADPDLIASYDDSDVRKTLFYEYVDENTGDAGQWTLKYGGKGSSSPDVNNIIILRLSDMYLIRAEAILNGASGSTAMADVNMIRNNRGVDPLTSNPTLAQVYEERRLEFAWEAQLFFDLGRTGRDMIRNDHGDNVPTELYFPDNKWVMGIPLREMQVNHNLVQNPGYADGN